MVTHKRIERTIYTNIHKIDRTIDCNCSCNHWHKILAIFAETGQQTVGCSLILFNRARFAEV